MMALTHVMQLFGGLYARLQSNEQKRATNKPRSFASQRKTSKRTRGTRARSRNNSQKQSGNTSDRWRVFCDLVCEIPVYGTG
jgi:hypothetical protein